MKIRTDLAAESTRLPENIHLKGISTQTETDDAAQLEIQRLEITEDTAAEKTGKPKGRYVTVKSSTTLDNFCEQMSLRAELIAEEIRRLCGDAEKILVAGLGNRSITPDAIGPLCADKTFATRHIKELATEIDTSELKELSVIAPGVLGQTGIEASDIVKALCERLRPDVVVVVDALACAETDNLGTTVQLTDTGISPGSGVANSRHELSQTTLGVKCIAVGIPTVIDMSTALHSDKSEYSQLMVTPRNIDRLCENGAVLVSAAVNLAFQPSLTFEELSSLTE